MPSTDTPLMATARLALACLDLTSLNDADTEADIERLCARALGPNGTPAAVCVWPRLARFARGLLPAPVAVAAVANFPAGGTDVQSALRDVGAIVDAGAQEVDVVLPWRALQSGDEAAAAHLLDAVRRACPGLQLKVILESGDLAEAGLIRRASAIALDAGADFLKTSTGKTGTGATPEAAQVMLRVLRERQAARPGPGGPTLGFKASGGVRKVADAAIYLEAVRAVLGPQAVGPQRLRIGASGLLDDITAVLEGRSGGPTEAGASSRY